MKKKMLIIPALIAGLCMTACGNVEKLEEEIVRELAAPAETDDETMYKVSDYESLAEGNFDGVITVGELKKCGNTGVGIFEGLDGELIFINYMIFQADSKGYTRSSRDEDRVAFAYATHFEEDGRIHLEEIGSLEAMEKELNAVVEENGQDIWYMAKIIGGFKNVKVRSLSKQEKLCGTLEEALEKGSDEFIIKEVYGTMIGVYSPDNRDGSGSSGWIFYFITGDSARGGRVLSAEIENAEACYYVTGRFEMIPAENAG